MRDEIDRTAETLRRLPREDRERLALALFHVAECRHTLGDRAADALLAITLAAESETLRAL
jgi:hypothetical protein